MKDDETKEGQTPAKDESLLPFAEEIAMLRDKLDHWDRAIIEAAAARQGLVAQIGALKAATGRSLFDRSREKAVFAKAYRNAEEYGLDREVAHDLFASLISFSHQRQENLVSAEITRNFLIVGGEGQMGRLFRRHLEDRGHTVDTLEPGDGKDRSERAQWADVVMISVPMKIASEVVREIGPLIRPDALLCDINSLKEEVCKSLKAHSAGEALGLHPMFGPSIQSLRRQKVVFCDVKPGPLSDWLYQEFGHLGFDNLKATPATHDRMMSLVQVLVHFQTIVMGDALRRTGIEVEESRQYMSPVYNLELSVVGRLFTQDPALYAEIEMSNPYGDEVLCHFRDATDELLEVVQSGDREAFHKVFNQAAEYFADFGQEAVEISDLLIEILSQRP